MAHRKKKCATCNTKLTKHKKKNGHRMMGQRMCNWCTGMWIHDCC